MSARRAHAAALVASIVALAAFVATATAQPRNTGVPNAVQGFSKNRDQPVHIEAATLEVRDKEKVAIFSGNVHVVQGDTEMRCKLLIVHYEGDSKSAKTRTASVAKSRNNVALPQPAFGGQQRIRRLEARGGVVVKRSDQVATGKAGVFDMKTNTVTLSGGVVLSQGPNVTRGDRLVVNLTTGVSRIESARNGTGRVRALIQPSSAKKPGATTSPSPNAARPPPGPPTPLH